MAAIDTLLLYSGMGNDVHMILGLVHFSNFFAVLLITCEVMPVIGCFIFLRREKNLRKEIALLKTEQQVLISDFENTVATLEQSTEEISQQHLFIKQLSIMLAHDLQSPFRFMKLGMETLHRAVLEQNYEDLEILSFELKQSSEYTYRFITDFTLWIKSINKDYKPKLEEVNLYEMIGDLNHFFAALLKSRKNKWSQDLPEDLKVFTDKELLKVIVRNIIDNANKHNFERTIKIACHATSENCALIISDNGTGLPDHALTSIHSYINAEKNTSFQNETPDGKHGHKLIAHFSKLLDLDININSKTNMGTTFMVSNLVKL